MSSFASKGCDKCLDDKCFEVSSEPGEIKIRCPLDLKTGTDPLIYHDCFSAVIYLLDATSIAQVGRCCKYLRKLISDSYVVAWLSAPRATGLVVDMLATLTYL